VSFRGVINEVADEKGCSSVLFFEARKRQDLYLWMVSVCERGFCRPRSNRGAPRLSRGYQWRHTSVRAAHKCESRTQV
jgi:hypothetical protein